MARQKRQMVAADLLDPSTRDMVDDSSVQVETVRANLLAVEQQICDTFVQRDEAVRVILLGVLSDSNFMLVGPPGTAKTSVIDSFVRHLDTPRRFKLLMGKFTQPEHVTGVLDISAFKQGRYEVVTDGMLTEATLPILDEVLKASDGCMNSLLGVLGPEREFQGERTRNLCVGAATNWPEVEGRSTHIEALFDRFLLRCVVTEVDRKDKELRRELYRARSKVSRYTPNVTITEADLIAARAAVADVEISDEVLDALDELIGKLVAPTTSAGKTIPSDIQVSDRRASQLQEVLRANAWLEGRDAVEIEDFEVLRHGLWNRHKHVSVVNAALENLDLARVQDLCRQIEVGRRAYQALKASNFPPTQQNKVCEELKAIARTVKAAMAAPVFTAKGRTQVKAAMDELYRDYQDIIARAEKSTTKGPAKSAP